MINQQVKLVTQRRRKINKEKKVAGREETKKLIEANHIREIQYPTWLSNVIMVKKASGKWRMRVDFTDLNNACPKDSYPLPNIDMLVDSALIMVSSASWTPSQGTTKSEGICSTKIKPPSWPKQPTIVTR